MAKDELIRLRYPATCVACGRSLTPGEFARWDRPTKTACCANCVASESTSTPEIDRGVAGASAAREYRRRQTKRVEDVQRAHKHLGGLILALSSDPRSTTAWATGAKGEQTIGRSLDRLREEGFAVLHDRRIPGSRANIDHIVISTAGVFVVDTKQYRGPVEKRDVGGWFRSDERLYVNGRNRTKLVAAMNRQVEAVEDALAGFDDLKAVPVTPALLFMSDGNWPLLASRPLQFGRVYALWGKKLGELIRADGPVGRDRIPELERILACACRAN